MPAQQQQATPRARSSRGVRAPVLLLGTLLLGTVAVGPSCAKPDDYLSADGKRGWQAYRRHCTQCHNKEPFKDGTSSPGGPAIARASEELIRLRVTGLKYPKGYKPKRDTNQMTRLPLAEPEVPYLYAYLKEVRKPE
ncbi:MAG: hypothetical protein ACYTGW_15370 [Planctomycetota bacterium]|jgi:mono/diheme cytochrome c family protein